jgi:hypothetical protein
MQRIVSKMNRPYTQENEFWLFFGYAEGWPPNKCEECYRLLEESKEPNRHCIDCWKLEIFFSNTTDLDAVKEYFLKEGQNDPTFHGKWLKNKIDVPWDRLTSIPKSAHPDVSVTSEGVILVYCQSIEEMERRRKKILGDLKALGLYKKSDISYRRGCVNFDEIIGNWKEWYDLNRDFEQ